ncbi:MAG: hypothetical protein H0T83_00185 [Chthoniobacterales bacterium]|nr:hypothetical protein [Chthoniobacterales bacterium]
MVTFDTTSLATATRIDLWNRSYVLQRTGDFIPFTSFQQNVTMGTPWIFTPSTPLPTLWSVGGFTFDLGSSVVITQNAQFLNIQATGTLTGNGFDPTPALWTFTASRSDGGNHATFGYQSRTVAIPEAGSSVLFGFGALALGLVLRRANRSSVATASR